jgi:hypothetical protein
MIDGSIKFMRHVQSAAGQPTSSRRASWHTIATACRISHSDIESLYSHWTHSRLIALRYTGDPVADGANP